MVDCSALQAVQACHTLVSADSSLGPPWWATTFAAPFVTAILTVGGAWIAIAFERGKTINQELTKKRIAIYDQMAPKLNELYCFFLIVGRWKQITPLVMLQNKRDLDHLFHIYEPLFSRPFREAYHRFINTCFETYTGAGMNARIRADLNHLRRHWGTDWDPAWDANMSPQEETRDHRIVKQIYLALMDQFAAEIGVQHKSSNYGWLQIPSVSDPYASHHRL